MIEQLTIILSLAGAALGLLITVVTFVVTTIKNARAKRIAQQTIRIGNAVVPFIREAEKFTAFSGEEKKAYVMTKANQFAIGSKIPFNPQHVSEKIEELIALTKQVNVRISAKEKAEIKKELETVTKLELQNDVNKSWL